MSATSSTRFWYLLISPCEVVSQATHGVYLFRSGLSNFFTLFCRSDLYLSLIGDLNIGHNGGIGYRLIAYLLVGRRTVNFLLWRFITQTCFCFLFVRLSCVEATFRTLFPFVRPACLGPRAQGKQFSQGFPPLGHVPGSREMAPDFRHHCIPV
jgi:hypothetical protein